MSQNLNTEKEPLPNVSWRYIEEGLNSGACNMAVDAALLQACEPHTGKPTLRLYGWKEPTLSIGYSQSLDREIDRLRLESQDIPWVRRPTGGRAILHEEELTYSVVAPVSHPLFEGGLKTTFSAISGALLEGLRSLGLENAQINREKKSNSDPLLRASPSCFALLNHCEITVEGRKLVGSAQRRTQAAFLQHGSILIRMDRKRLNSILKFMDERQRRHNLEILERSTVTLSEIFGPESAYLKVRAAIRKGFENHFGGTWARGELSPQERVLLPETVAPAIEGAAHG